MHAQVGKPAPDFKLKSTKNATNRNDLGFQVSLSDYTGKWLVLFFYPLDFTFVCPTEILAFSDRYDEFTALGAEVLGGSCDSEYSHWAWISTPRDKNGIGGLRYPLIADYKKEIARAYGVLDEDSGQAQRGLFIIDPEGVVRYATVTNSNIGRSVDETLRVLQALQTGSRCPADWKPGKPTLVVSG
jgi:alkyl hydroperoxide reductase subunit AhpC